MSLVEGCDAHQGGFHGGILFLSKSAKICQQHFEQTLRGVAIIQFCNLRQKKIDTGARFGLEHGRFRRPFAEQNKKDWDHSPSPRTREGLIPGTKQNASATL